MSPRHAKLNRSERLNLLFCPKKNCNIDVTVSLSIIFASCPLIASIFIKTFKTIYRAISTGLKRHFRIYTTAGTDCRVHFARGTGSPAAKASFSAVSLLACGPALGTATRLVGKALFSIELLLGCCENKIQATVTAVQGFVLIHEEILLKIICSMVIHLSLISITILAAEKDK